MRDKHQQALPDDEARTFEDCRTIDVHDQKCLQFWSERLGVTEQDIAEVVREVGPNSTAVALKLEAPNGDRTAPPSLSMR
jgi:hypothetical protein